MHKKTFRKYKKNQFYNFLSDIDDFKNELTEKYVYKIVHTFTKKLN